MHGWANLAELLHIYSSPAIHQHNNHALLTWVLIKFFSLASNTSKELVCNREEKHVEELVMNVLFLLWKKDKKKNSAHSLTSQLTSKNFLPSWDPSPEARRLGFPTNLLPRWSFPLQETMSQQWAPIHNLGGLLSWCDSLCCYTRSFATCSGDPPFLHIPCWTSQGSPQTWPFPWHKLPPTWKSDLLRSR